MAVLSSWGQWSVMNSDTVSSVWSGINGTKGNETITLAARPMGGWAVLDASDGYDIVELTFLGATGNQDSASSLFFAKETATDWTLNAINVERFIAAENVIADTNPWSHVDLYLTSSVNNFSTDGSIRSIYGTGGTQNISFDSGVVNNLYATNYNVGRYTSFAATQDSDSSLGGIQPLVMADNNNSTGQANNDFQRGGHRDFEENFIIIDLGGGHDTVTLNGNSLTVDNRYWKNTFLWWGYYHYEQYIVSEWSLYYAAWDNETFLHAYNNFKDYTIQFRNVEQVIVSYSATLGPGSGSITTPVDPRSVYLPRGSDPTDPGFGTPVFDPLGGTPPNGPYTPGYTPPGNGADPTDPTGSGGFGNPYAIDPTPYATDGRTPNPQADGNYPTNQATYTYTSPASGTLQDPVLVLPRATSGAVSPLSAGYVLGISAPTDNSKTQYFLREVNNSGSVDIDSVTLGNQDRVRLAGDNNANSSADALVPLLGTGFKEVNLVAQTAVTVAQVQYQVFTDAGLSNEIIILGTVNNDTITSVASAGPVGIYGFGGNDTISGSSANEIILGGIGNDSIDGGAGDDYIDGENGDDIIQGGFGNDTLLGGAGNDVIHANSVGNGAGDADVVNGGSGNDTIYAAGNDTVDGGAGDDILIANNGGYTSRTFFIDNSGNNTITTDGNDAVYFGAPLASGQPNAVGSNATVARDNYTNTVNNNPSETVTMLLEYGATARSIASKNANPTVNNAANQNAAGTSFFIADASRLNLNLTSVANANFDLVNVFGGDQFDKGYRDNTIKVIWTFFQSRQTWTIQGQQDDNSIYTSSTNNPFTSLSNLQTLSDWMSDGEIFYGRPNGAFSPWDPDIWRVYDANTPKAVDISVQSGWSGYLNFYLSSVNKTYVWYARDANANGSIPLNTVTSELTYIGVINGRAGGSLQYSSLLDGALTEQATVTVVVNPPMPVLLRLSAEDDTGDSNSDGLTKNISNLTLTGLVDPQISGGRLYKWFDAVDIDGNGSVNSLSGTLSLNERQVKADLNLDGVIGDVIVSVTHVSEAMYGVDFDRDGFLESDLRLVENITELAASKTLIFEWIDANNNGMYDSGEFGSFTEHPISGNVVRVGNDIILTLGSPAKIVIAELDPENNPTISGTAINLNLTDRANGVFERFVLSSAQALAQRRCTPK